MPCSMAVNGRSGVGCPPWPPIMWDTQDKAEGIGNWITARASRPSREHSTMAVVPGRPEEYSS